jgi:hypothetical protein
MQHLTAELIAHQRVADMRREASTLGGTSDRGGVAGDGVSTIRRWLATVLPARASHRSVRHRVVRL